MAGNIRLTGKDGGLPTFHTSGVPDNFSTFQKIWGEDLFSGMTAGVVLGLAAKLAFGVSTPVTAFAVGATAVGALAGGIINYNKFQDSVDSGKEIKPPKRLNSGIIKGLFSGFSMGASLTMLAGSLFSISAIATGIVPLAIGGALAAYTAYTRSTSQYEREAKEYDGIKQAYEIQEGIYNPAKTRMANMAQGIGAAVAPAIGAGAAINSGVSSPEPEDITSSVGTITSGFDPSTTMSADKAAANDENIAWHPAQDRKAGHSFAKAEQIRRQNNALSQQYNQGTR